MIELSIIIPNYKTEPNLFFKCINSIIYQHENKIELIIVDDGSSEEYRNNVYKDLLFTDQRITILFKNNGGVSSARNMGIKAAKGKYISFVDADDVVTKNFIRESLDVADEFDADMVIGGVIAFSDDSEMVEIEQDQKMNYDEVITYKDGEIEEVKSLLLGVPRVFSKEGAYFGRGPVSKIIKREIAKSVNFNEKLTIYEDTVWNFDVVSKSKVICLVEKAWYGYHNTTQSAAKGFHPDEIDRSTRGMCEIAQHINLSNIKLHKAFVEQCIIEYSRIVNSYFFHKNHTGSLISKLKESRSMLAKTPWTMITSFSDLKGLSYKMKLYGVIYKLNIWILIKRLLSKNN